jgi:hypothetical protein
MYVQLGNAYLKMINHNKAYRLKSFFTGRVQVGSESSSAWKKKSNYSGF